MTSEHTETEEEQLDPGEQTQADEPSRGEDQTPHIPLSPVPLSPLSKSIGALLEAKQTTQDRLLRTAADFENFKKRSRKDSREGAQRAENRVVTEFLPVLDNLQRALSHTDAAREGLLEGVKMVNKQFLAIMERFEIKPFSSIGEVFNPERHEAIQQIHSERPAGMICEELQVGYLRGERLVRPSMVIVSLGPASSQAPGENDNQDSVVPDEHPSGDGEIDAN